MSDDFQKRDPVPGHRALAGFRAAARRKRIYRALLSHPQEQLLWIRHFRDLEELRTALIGFRNRYNDQWILQRLNYRTPVQARHDFTLELQAAA